MTVHLDLDLAIGHCIIHCLGHCMLRRINMHCCTFMHVADVDVIGLYYCMQVPQTGQDALYVTGRTINGVQLLLELRFLRGQPGIDASFKSERVDLAAMAFDAVSAALAH